MATAQPDPAHARAAHGTCGRAASGTTAEFAALSAVRAGVEGTISQAVRGFGLRRSRYIGHAKTHPQHVATAAAMNLVRMTEWLGGAELATTRRSTFRTLMAQAA